MSNVYLSGHEKPVSVVVDDLAQALKDECPEVLFAFLMGSAAGGLIAVGSDIDIALYIQGRPTLDLHGRVVENVSKHAPSVHCGVGVLNNAEPVYRFESLRGKLLFTRDEDAYHRFFSVPCREYENRTFH